MKRFTATEKWDDPWFWELPPQSKLLWIFLCDHCDGAGVIEISFKFASMKIGLTVNEKHLFELQSRLHALPCGKIFITRFIRFQYGILSRDCKPHNPIFASLSKHGIDLTQIETLSKGFGNPSGKGTGTLQDKEKEKEPEKKEGVQGEIDAFPEVLKVTEFKAAWNRWHDHLKQKRKPATIHARDMQLAKLASMGAQKAIITLNHCIEHNWQGIYEPSATGNGYSATKPNPRNFGIAVGPTNYGTAKPRLQREIEEKRRLAEQVAANEDASPQAGNGST